MKALMAVVLLGLCGCASANRQVTSADYVPHGRYTAEEPKERAFDQCSANAGAQARVAQGGGSVMQILQAQEVYKAAMAQCMRAKGYRLR